jgi:Lanthionine synthetase C-like protein/HopA1 effector protein family
MNAYLEQLKTTVQATVLFPSLTFSWFGKRSQPLPSKLRKFFSPTTLKNVLLVTLQENLYTNFYCKGCAAPLDLHEHRSKSLTGIRPFVKELSAVNSGIGYWDKGWLIRSVGDKKIILFQAGLELRIDPEYCLISQGTSLTPGNNASIRFPKDFPEIAPGFYLAASNEPFEPDDWQSIVRLYWNLTPKGAIHFTRSTTSMLNQAGLPFRLKILSNPAQFSRCDSVVLYLYRNDCNRACEILQRIYFEVIDELRQGIPALTKPIAAGVGLAEDPGQNNSFGIHRCRILAEGMILASEQGLQSVEERLQVVCDSFAKNNICLETPFLNAGSVDRYAFTPPSQNLQLAHPRSPITNLEDNTVSFLETAYLLGQRLCQEAIWYQKRCNWIGAVATDLDGLTYSVLDANLYSGTSGVGLFLAEIYAATGDSIAKKTARGAIRQAIAKADTVVTSARLGLFSGWLGIALATVRVGILLEDKTLLEQSAQLLQRTRREHQARQEADLISGNAGAIAALLLLSKILDDSSLLNFAMQLGEELLNTAIECGRGYAWRTINSTKECHLTGFSHGAAGIAYALLELFQATGESKYRQAAELAFNYEQNWFNADLGNWVDLRGELMRRKTSIYPKSFSTFWCHGAPGIALSRLRAYEIIKNEKYKAEAIIALQTTYRAIQTQLYSGMTNFSLCHGLAGNAEVLLIGNRVLGEEFAIGTKVAKEVARVGIEMYAKSGHQWPCGTAGGTTPSLMVGLAGIGYFYLRLYNPAIPSVLLLPHC